MKKHLLLLCLCCLATSVFGFPTRLQTLFADYIYTSEGVFFGGMDYYGKNTGQEMANELNSRDYLIQTTKISNGRWEAVRNMMNRYQHSTGDTYYFFLGFIPHVGRSSVDAFHIVIEFITSTQYRWWAFYDKTGEVWRFL